MTTLALPPESQPVEPSPVAVIPVLQARVHALEADNRRLALQVQDLKQQLWGKTSERSGPPPAAEVVPGELFAALAPTPPSADAAATAALLAPLPASRPAPARSGAPARLPGRQPLDPALQREVIRLPDPDPRQRVCALTGAPLVAGFTETLEVLARRRPAYFVQRYERTVWVSPAKTAPLATPWPAAVWSRAGVDVSVVAHLATAHYADHQPFYRLEQQLARTGIALARSSQVSLMQQLDTLVAPLVDWLQQQVLTSDYLHLDATPIAVCDPARPGQTREATLWAYRVSRGPHAGTVWFDYQPTKSPRAPQQVLTAAPFRGLLQTDGAAGFDQLGVPGQVTHLGCWAHARRPFFKAVQLGERRAEPYLRAINRLYRIERRLDYFGLAPPEREHVRTRFSVPLVEDLLARAAQEALAVPPKTPLGAALGYLLAQQASLRRCVTTPGARLDNNWAENTVRPLKLGAKNWLFLGRPSAGPRLAHLFTLVENARQAGLDIEGYLQDVLTRLPETPAWRLADLAPPAWQRARAVGLLNAAASPGT